MAAFFAASHILIVAGKGGVGKTTVGASLGVASARSGLDTLLVELEGHSTLGRSFGHEHLPYEDLDLTDDDPTTVEAGGRLRARRITPDDALVDYLTGHGLQRISGRLTENGTIDVVATAAPGIRDLLALGKIRQITAETGAPDLIIVDAPASGHALTFLRAATGLAEAGAEGPVKEQADLVAAMLADERQARVMLVTLPEETPVSELIETAFSLEDDVGIALAPLVVNSVTPSIPGLESELKALDKSLKKKSPTLDHARSRAAHHRLRQEATQRSEIERLTTELPLPRIELPRLVRAGLGRADISALADALQSQIDELDARGLLGDES